MSKVYYWNVTWSDRYHQYRARTSRTTRREIREIARELRARPSVFAVEIEKIWFDGKSWHQARAY